MNKIYIIIGETGEYDDHTTWMLRAYRDYDEAAYECTRLNNVLKKVGAYYSRNKLIDFDKLPAIMDKLCICDDPELKRIDYTGAKYEIREVDFVDDDE